MVLNSLPKLYYTFFYSCFTGFAYRLSICLIFIIGIGLTATAQNNLSDAPTGYFSGDLQFTAKFYDADSVRGATNIPFYDYLFYGSDTWLTLQYQKGDLNLGVRYDIFANSQIFDPTRPVNEQGIGRWWIAHKIQDLSFTAGYFYEQYASGIIFRAYEARALGIDQAIFGIRLQYELAKNWRISAFSGRLKNRFETYEPVVKGANIEGYVQVGKLRLQPGLAVVNRTLDAKTMQNITDEINSFSVVEDRFIPEYNVYATSLYNTLTSGNWSWYAELALKSEDVIRGANGQLINPDSGIIGYTSLTYSRKGFGIILQSKYTEDFDLRVSPNTLLNRGLLNFLPPLARQNSYRLTARYNAAVQPLGELAFSGNATYTPKRGTTFNLSYADLRNLDGDQLFREIYAQATLQKPKSPQRWVLGLQAVDYNQAVYEQKGDFVHTLTPFVEYNYKFTRKKAIKLEASYMLTKRNYRLFGEEDPHPEKLQDLGDWAWLLAEYTMAPHWAIAVTDAYNIDNELHYPSLLVAYSQRATRIALSYAKQPAGIICTGGVCRFEPAFSGARLDITTTF